MKTSFAFVPALVAALFTNSPTLAAPAPNDCSPNFQGQAFSVVNLASGKHWLAQGTSVSAVTPGQGGTTYFHAESTGGWPSTQYIVKINGVDANNLALGSDGRSRVGVVPVSNQTPAFTVKCATCTAPGSPVPSSAAIGQGCYFIYGPTGEYIFERPDGTVAFGAYQAGAADFNLNAA